MTIALHPDPVTIHTWSIWCGLSMLAARGEIDLSFERHRVPAEKSIWMRVTDRERGEQRLVNIDVADGAAIVSPHRNRVADVVFKRSPASDGVRPLGLVAGMRTGAERTAAYRAHSVSSALRSRDLGAARAAVAGLRRTAWPPLMSQYMSPAGGETKVLLQVRAWDPDAGSNPADRDMVNARRSELITAMRDAFGSRFVGGFVPNDYARQHFGDQLSTAPSSQSEYLELVHSCRICISTVGLHGSNPWKLVEYLAGSRAIVSEPLVFPVPEPLDTAVRTFSTAQECVAIVDGLLTRPNDLGELEREAAAYWSDNVRPDVLVRKRLEEALAR